MSKWLGRIGAILIFLLVINVSVNGVMRYEPMTDQEYAQTPVARFSAGVNAAKKNAIKHVLDATGYNKSAEEKEQVDSKDTVSNAINKIFKIDSTSAKIDKNSRKNGEKNKKNKDNKVQKTIDKLNSVEFTEEDLQELKELDEKGVEIWQLAN